MKFSELIGKKLKDPEIIELLEQNEIEVVYDFDRHFENMDDVYWASCEVGGFQLRFNKEQILDTVFLYLSAHDGFSPIQHSMIDVKTFENFDNAESYYKENAMDYIASPGEPGSDMFKWWIKVQLGNIKIHHQFEQEKTIRVTLFSNDA
ncbi:hypothetical protein [Thalassotalea euphylliae]|uniref:Uncharacterized protein n=1 Tax=Thalassotalea euphylliae TaxID=1655234 RepID=A0A3E0UHQ8_9GAMM|nr:hypothetical protein [Thalassotalea euphylliae]REL35705.1 hypothetical protein DXX92_10340 [Thalassotalea euphylliae]